MPTMCLCQVLLGNLEAGQSKNLNLDHLLGFTGIFRFVLQVPQGKEKLWLLSFSICQGGKSQIAFLPQEDKGQNR